MKGFLSILGFLGLLPLAYTLSLLIRGGATGWGWAWMLFAVVFDLGLMWLSNEPRRARIALGLAAALFGILAGLRTMRSHPTGVGTLVRLPEGSAAPWYAKLGEESDLSGMLYTVFTDTGAISGDDARSSRNAYRTLRRAMYCDGEFRPVPSILMGELLGGSSPSRPLAYVFNAPVEGERADRAVIVMHGAGGAQKLPCWMLARRMPDAMVVCPSAGLGGEWANDTGRAIFQMALEYVTPRSNATYVFAFQYGARGALHLLNGTLRGHVAGVALISGYDENYVDDVRRSNIPMLIVRGTTDARTPAFRLEGQGGLARIHHLDVEGGNMVFYEQSETLLEELDTFAGAH